MKRQRTRTPVFSIVLLTFGMLMMLGAGGLLGIMKFAPSRLPSILQLDADDGATDDTASSDAAAAAAIPDLRTVLVKVPTDAGTLPNLLKSTDGAVTVDQAATLYDDEQAGREALQTDGFRDGATTAYLLADGTGVFVYLLRFNKIASASTFATGNLDGYERAAAVSGVPSGKYANEVIDGKNYTTAVFAKGPLAVGILVVGGTAAKSDIAVKTAQDQYALLP